MSAWRALIPSLSTSTVFSPTHSRDIFFIEWGTQYPDTFSMLVQLDPSSSLSLLVLHSVLPPTVIYHFSLQLLSHRASRLLQGQSQVSLNWFPQFFLLAAAGHFTPNVCRASLLLIAGLGGWMGFTALLSLCLRVLLPWQWSWWHRKIWFVSSCFASFNWLTPLTERSQCEASVSFSFPHGSSTPSVMWLSFNHKHISAANEAATIPVVVSWSVPLLLIVLSCARSVTIMSANEPSSTPALTDSEGIFFCCLFVGRMSFHEGKMGNDYSPSAKYKQ